MEQAYNILNEIFGYQEFRLSQEKIIENVLAKRDVLSIMPTGGGKSLCYQIPSCIFPNLTLVVSPLISLMKDQVDALERRGINAEYLCSALSVTEYDNKLDRIARGKVKIVYVAPESLSSERIIMMLQVMKIDCVAIDEAHCISEWGHDFRPSYRNISNIKHLCKNAVFIACTATATNEVQNDIVRSLELKNPLVCVSTFDRKNLKLHAEKLKYKEMEDKIYEIIRKHDKESGIIYCVSKKDVEKICYFLEKNKVATALPYHAGLKDSDRTKNQESFCNDDVNVMVATIAFGMGIDKPDIRYIIHYGLPKNLESYYQQIGRAGRDGSPSECFLFYNGSDYHKTKYIMTRNGGDFESFNNLNLMYNYAESVQCRRKFILKHFGETYTAKNCANCDICILTSIKEDNELYKKLSLERSSLASKYFVDVSDIVSDYTLTQLSLKFSELSSTEDLLKIPGFNKTKIKKYGKGFFDLILNYKIEKGINNDSNKEAENYDHKLFDLLRQKRKEISTSEKCKPYMIFSDKSLIEMSKFYPLDFGHLSKINGVGKVKIEKYGLFFIEIIDSYCKNNNIKANLSQEPDKKIIKQETPQIIIVDYDKNLFEHLSNKYHDVLSENLIIEICYYYPLSIPNLFKILGTSDLKIYHHINDILNDVKLHCQTNNLSEKYKTFKSPTKRIDEIGSAFVNGDFKNIDDIASSFNIKNTTMISYLSEYFLPINNLINIETYNKIRSLCSLDDEIFNNVKEAFIFLGCERLKPVYEQLDGSVSYDDLHIARLCLRCYVV